jgi:16S rRNA (uracil1498-N3)-methyltransferase
VLMSVDDPCSWDVLLQRFTDVTARFVLHTGRDLQPLARLSEPAGIAVGPEGGLTESEWSAAVEAGWQLRSLGPRTLRMETAAIAAASIV